MTAIDLPLMLDIRVGARALPYMALAALVLGVLTGLAIWVRTVNPGVAVFAVVFAALALIRIGVVAFDLAFHRGGIRLDAAGFSFRGERETWANCTPFEAGVELMAPVIAFRVYSSTVIDSETGNRIRERTLPDIFELDRRSLCNLMNRFRDRALSEAP